MYEKDKRKANTLPAMRKNLEYIPISSDSGRRVRVSCMPKKNAITKSLYTRIEREETLFDVMDKVGCAMSFIASMAMIYLVIRVSYGVLWL